jgi:hypothetical protein
MSTPTPITYSDVSDMDVLINYHAACAAEVAYHDAGKPAPAIVVNTADAWMREGMRRGIL